jgi:UDP-N-acetylmuramate--alanine ligase
MPDLRKLMKEAPIHFMGIGGAGMCALAEAVLREGGRVTGCDLAPGAATHALERMGVRILKGHDPAHLADASALVVSAAVPAEHPEVAEARARGLPVLKRAVALGAWVDHGRVVAVAGTHGKTTTTAMITAVLESGGLRPTGFVGGEVAGWESHLRPGAGELFVVEADEYDRSFHHLRPSVALVTNLEEDHLDVYGSLEGVREGFRTFLAGVREGGTVIACADDPGAGQLVQGLPMTVVTYGLSAGAMLRGVEVDRSPTGARVRVMEGGVDAGSIEISLPGLHNVRNALGAAAAARTLGVGWDRIREGLAGFGGVRRRFQRLGEARGIAVVDDYAHHPTEVRAALEAARHAFPRRRLVAVFQPHLFTRTRDLAVEFGEALALADACWVTAVYPARETPIEGVDAELVVRAVERAGGREVHLHAELDSLARALSESLREGDLCLTLGAGSIERTGPELVEILRGAGREHGAGRGHGAGREEGDDA